MKELKFRAWVKDTKGEPYMAVQGTPDIETLGSFAHHYMWREEAIRDGDIVLMQYTGLKDKNGTEIYEGDVVKINHPQDMTGDFTDKLGRVFWWNEEGGWYHGHESIKNGSGRPPKRMWQYCEVIGNIYENPELLK